MWGGRFALGPAEALNALNRSLPVDHRLWPQDVAASKAWVHALARVGILTPAEEVTLLAGEPAEKERLLDRFGRVVGNWYGIMQRTKRLTFLTAGYSQIAIIFPFIVVSPLYFAGSMMLGGLMQIASAFGQVQGALSFFVKAYSEIADWKAVLNRLAGFDASMDWAKGLDTAAPRVNHVSDGGTAMVTDDLTVSLPNGEEIVRVSGRRARAGHRSIRLRQDEPVPGAWRRVAVRRRHHPHPEGRETSRAAAEAISAARHLARRARLSRAAGRFLAG